MDLRSKGCAGGPPGTLALSPARWSVGARDELLVPASWKQQFLEEVLQTEEEILEDPEPIVRVHELGDSSINFIVRPWVPSSEYWEVKWSLTEKIKLGFDERGFTFPFPSRDVHVHNAEAA